MTPLSPEDAEAFRTLFHRHRGRLYAQAFRILGDQGLALDAVQETFLAFWRKLPHWDDRIPVEGWLAETAWRCAQAQRRRRPRGKPLEEGVEPAAASSPPSWAPGGIEAREERKRLWDAVEELSPRDREAVLMRFLQGLSTEEVAASMGITSKAVSSHLARAMGALRGKIDRSS